MTNTAVSNHRPKWVAHGVRLHRKVRTVADRPEKYDTDQENRHVNSAQGGNSGVGAAGNVAQSRRPAGRMFRAKAAGPALAEVDS